MRTIWQETSKGRPQGDSQGGEWAGQEERGAGLGRSTEGGHQGQWPFDVQHLQGMRRGAGSAVAVHAWATGPDAERGGEDRPRPRPRPVPLAAEEEARGRLTGRRSVWTPT